MNLIGADDKAGDHAANAADREPDRDLFDGDPEHSNRNRRSERSFTSAAPIAGSDGTTPR